ncbi:MAG: hypothetical protein GKS00_01850 [Alphaproteobacteria bacterium]|nr:hypothetical protein [Alphaproteobacteria bacterium]
MRPLAALLAFLAVHGGPLWIAPAQAAPAGCVPVSELCTVGAAKRTIQGFEIERDCWERRVVYACPDARPGGVCAVLSDAPDCTRTGAECSERGADGVCLEETNTFRCARRMSGAGISLEGVAAGPAGHAARSPLQCGSTLYCPDGLCQGLGESEASGDFGKAAAWMGLLTQMGKEKDPDAVTLFRGQGRKCSRWTLGAKDCCSDDGWLLDTFGCSESEKILAETRAARQTHSVGSYCSKRSPFGCLVRKKSYCSFRSLFARVFQEQARAQLGIGWGSAKRPDCRPLSIEEIQRVDFARVDLSEIYDDMLGNAQVPSQGSVSREIRRRIETYYRRQE